MLDLTQFFSASAWAQASSGTPPAPGGMGAQPFSFMIPLTLIMLVFYVLLIRPQQKKFDEQTKMVKALQRGDRVVTNGGIYGKITKLEGDDVLIVEIADGVNIKIQRSAVQSLAAKTQPVAASANDEGDKK